MPVGYRIVGIAPRELDGQPDAVRLMYWGWVLDYGLKAKDRELSQGLDLHGDPLRPISLATRKHRKSEMTPSGKGDPNAPPLMPGRGLSRTRSLLAGTAYPDRAEFFWRYDPYTFNSWARVLTFQQAHGRDVFGLSPEAVQRVRQQALVKWRAWLKKPTIPVELVGKQAVTAGAPEPLVPVGKTNLTHVDFGIGASREQVEQAAREGRFSGLMTIDEWKRHFRQPAKIEAYRSKGQTSYSVREGAASVILKHILGAPGKGRMAGGVEPLTPKPKPKKPQVQRAAIEPAKAVQKPVVQPPPIVALTLQQFADGVLAAARAVPDAERYYEGKVWIIDAFHVFIRRHPEISLAEFKRRLMEAHQAGKITLARADTAGWHPGKNLTKDAASQIDWGVAEFHVIMVR